jgi:methionyl-tRNA formyltransferase
MERPNLVLGTRPWNRRVFDEVISRFPGTWRYFGGERPLTLEAAREVDPRYLFFLHWSSRVPREVLAEYECVAFHMTDLPYGRGGSPLQNLISRGHRSTKLTAFRMVEELDAGPIYLKEDLSLEGSAEEVYLRASELSARMIRRFLEEKPAPAPQAGQPTVFKRRTPAESAIPELGTLPRLFDFLRMLDAEGYPPAFLEHLGFRYEFSRAVLKDGRIVADVAIRPAGEKEGRTP